MKRFYKKATTDEVNGRFFVLLDGKPIRTPAKTEFSLESKNLADAVAKEWDTQVDTVDPETMPFMQFAATAIDRVTPQRDTVVEDIVAYVGTDLICYRAEHPQDLVRKQNVAWDPLIDWAKTELNVELKKVHSIQHVTQPEKAISSFKKHVTGSTDLELAALYNLTSLSGSAIIAMAVKMGRVSSEEAFDISELDETHVIEQWGEDAESIERRNNIKKGLKAAEAFLTLCKQH